jgi:hypothetical protein
MIKDMTSDEIKNTKHSCYHCAFCVYIEGRNCYVEGRYWCLGYPSQKFTVPALTALKSNECCIWQYTSVPPRKDL